MSIPPLVLPTSPSLSASSSQDTVVSAATSRLDSPLNVEFIVADVVESLVDQVVDALDPNPWIPVVHGRHKRARFLSPLNGQVRSSSMPPFNRISRYNWPVSPMSPPVLRPTFSRTRTAAAAVAAVTHKRRRSSSSSSSSSDASSLASHDPRKSLSRSMSMPSCEPISTSTSLFRYLLCEITYSQAIHPPNVSTNLGNLSSFARVPFYLERLMLLGFFVCLDEFLYAFTLMPLRICMALMRLTTVAPVDVIRALLLTICCALLSLLNITFSSVYHLIRGQNFFKLYVLFNILTIFDKLCCSFGEDILDALFANANSRLFSRHTVLDLFIASIYVILHSLILYLQIVSLNVAINSNNSALVSLLISNNFLELKSSVFKKYTKAQLFQIASSDIVERFHLTLYVVVILMANLRNLDWSSAVDWLIMSTQLAMILLSMEMVVDWIKHGCIVKFNSFPFAIYEQFRDVLCADFARSRSSSSTVDATQTVSRRVGFVSMPIACILLRGVFLSSLSFSYIIQERILFSCCVIALLFAIIVAFKLLLGIILLGVSAHTAMQPPNHVQAYHRVERYSIFIAPPTNTFV